MLLKKWIGLFAAAGVVAASAVAGCSSTTTTTPGAAPGAACTANGECASGLCVQNVCAASGDSGVATDGKATDSKPDKVSSGDTGQTGDCSPQAVTNPGTPTPPYKAYLKTPACTTTQLSTFYTACVDDNATTTTCGAWEND